MSVSYECIANRRAVGRAARRDREDLPQSNLTGPSRISEARAIAVKDRTNAPRG
jgi:hypothetical protein